MCGTCNAIFPIFTTATEPCVLLYVQGTADLLSHVNFLMHYEVSKYLAFFLK